MSYNENLDNFTVNTTTYGTDYNDIDPLPDADDLINGTKLITDSELAIDDTRDLRLLQNANLIGFDQNGNSVKLSKNNNLKISPNIPIVLEILKNNNDIKVQPVPDTVESGNIINVITNALKTDGTSEVLSIQGRSIISNPIFINTVIQTNPDGITGSSVLETNSTTDIAIPIIMGAHGPQRIAKVRINPNAKPIIMCKGKTLKGTDCSRKAAPNCKYCSQHYKKRLEFNENSESEIEEKSDLEESPEVIGKNIFDDTTVNEYKKNTFNEIMNDFKNKYNFDQAVRNKIYDLMWNLVDKILSINTLDDFNKFVDNNISDGFINAIKKVENYNLYDKQIFIIKYIIESLIDYSVELSENGVITVNNINEAVDTDEDLSITLNPSDDQELAKAVQNTAIKELDVLDSAVNNFDYDIDMTPELLEKIQKAQLLNDDYSEESDYEIDQVAENKPVKIYKKTSKLIPKSIDVKKYKELKKVFNLKPSKIIPNKYKNEIIIKPISLSEVTPDTKLFKLLTESNELFEYRKKYTEFAYELGENTIKWDSCIVLGKIKVNKITFGITYDEEMENLLNQIDSNYK
jgi:hypothetical protein